MPLRGPLGHPLGPRGGVEHDLNDVFLLPPPLHFASLDRRGLPPDPPFTLPSVHDDLHIVTSLGRLCQEIRKIGAGPRNNDVDSPGTVRKILSANERADEEEDQWFHRTLLKVPDA